MRADCAGVAKAGVGRDAVPAIRSAARPQTDSHRGVPLVHEFDEFRLCTERRALFRDEVEVRLRRKAYECLRHLVEQSPRAVPKDELCDVVWSPRIISTETLTSTIKDIRLALGDRGEPRRYVRTLSGFGYRFVAPVVVVA
jgi:DNA-binding winged helix-turn-helix (wHTH) protein